jgi:hypothetical protein
MGSGTPRLKLQPTMMTTRTMWVRCFASHHIMMMTVGLSSSSSRQLGASTLLCTAVPFQLAQCSTPLNQCHDTARGTSHARTHTLTHVRTHTHVRARMHARTHARTHTRTHAQPASHHDKGPSSLHTSTAGSIFPPSTKVVSMRIFSLRRKLMSSSHE